jgi:RimJ/RimL family protein N-acetyltransferase
MRAFGLRLTPRAHKATAVAGQCKIIDKWHYIMPICYGVAPGFKFTSTDPLKPCEPHPGRVPSVCDETARRTFSDLLATAHCPVRYEATLFVYALVMNRQPILQDDSVILTPLQQDEFEELLAVASDPLIWAQHPNPDRWKREIFRTYFDGALASGGAFMIRDKAHRNAIGSTRFYDHDAEASEIKIGYTFFSRNQWGNGTNQRVKKLMLDHAFQYVRQVIFHVGAQNMRSRIAMQRLGAELIGEEEVAYFGEQPKRNVVFRITAP